MTEDEVRDEHLREVKPVAHWLYLIGVLAGGLVLMVFFMALLGGP